jgi:hypothetical protein
VLTTAIVEYYVSSILTLWLVLELDNLILHPALGCLAFLHHCLGPGSETWMMMWSLLLKLR